MFYNSMLALLWWIAIYPIASNSSLSNWEYPLLKYKSISYSGLVEEQIKSQKELYFIQLKPNLFKYTSSRHLIEKHFNRISSTLMFLKSSTSLISRSESFKTLNCQENRFEKNLVSS
jgi:hypothetical protein